ncbi:hypothetical protein L3Q82_008866 [Scortum barcoo]|uniref:Uncharacterized protein n=1 Tax=Scortum barcoo TaxID=214431 RepID=A0ACB8XCV6_9TELE|nr:hypothetical protein L3Q82_008866 [Scortum barcoo]
MAKWFKEHLGFKTAKAPPPAPPKPDYRHCHTGVPGALQTSSAASFPSAAQPDILAAYKLQKELDFEDPYTPGGNIAFGSSLNAAGSPDIKYVSPKHRLIKVETIEKSSPAPGGGGGGGGVTVTQAVAVGSVKSPTSPPSEHDNKEKVVLSGDKFVTVSGGQIVTQFLNSSSLKTMRTLSMLSRRWRWHSDQYGKSDNRERRLHGAVRSPEDDGRALLLSGHWDTRMSREQLAHSEQTAAPQETLSISSQPSASAPTNTQRRLGSVSSSSLSPLFDAFVSPGCLLGEGNVGCEITKKVPAALSVMRALYLTVVVKKELNQNMNLLISQQIQPLPRNTALTTSLSLLFAEIRSGGRGPKEGSVRQLPLYDTPYEPVENGGDSDPERLRCPRESRLPQDDERPPEEYDQPWEWKKDRISKAFAALLCYDCISYEGSVSGTGSGPHGGKDCTSKSLTVEIKVIKDLPWPPPVGQLNTSPPLVEELESPSQTPQPSPGQTSCDQHHHVQFDGVEKSRMSPTKEGKTRPLQRHSSGCLVNTKMTSLDHCSSSVGERIDPTMPLESQFWYHGAISRTDAESLLRLCKEASYLVRNSETSKNDYSLSLKSSQGFMHMKLSRTKENKYILGQNSCPFDSVPEIIHFYSSRKLPIKGAEHMSLLYPVAIRTL